MIEDRVEEMKVKNRATVRSQMFLTQWQISDALQEFLCTPDQLKLLSFEAAKLEQLAALNA
jgi:hypothetical protein